MTTLHATPYNRDAAGFYFTDAHDYEAKSTVHVDRYGNLVEEFEIQFIDGDDAQLFEACGINQANLNIWFDDIEFLNDYEKVNLYYLLGVAGYTLSQALEKLDEPSITESSLRDAAEELFDECWLSSVVKQRAILSRLGVETASNSFHLSMSLSSVLAGDFWSDLYGHDL